MGGRGMNELISTKWGDTVQIETFPGVHHIKVTVAIEADDQMVQAVPVHLTVREAIQFAERLVAAARRVERKL
jgi:hypothetical protein